MRLAFWIWFSAAAISASAQVRELWRTGLTNSWALCDPNSLFCQIPSTNYFAEAAAVDGSGNTIVAGQKMVQSNIKPFVAKFAPTGRKLWENVLPDAPQGSVQGPIALDAQGNVALAVRCPGLFSPAMAVKVSSDGRELWRFRQNQFSDWPFSGPNAGVAVDRFGNTFFAAMVATPGAGWAIHITKINRFGRRAWHRTLPGYGYRLTESGLSKSLLPLEDGSLILAGARDSGFLAKLSPFGGLTWFSPYVNRVVKSPPFSSALALKNGNIWAASSDRFSIINRLGQVVRSGVFYGDPVVSNDKKMVLAISPTFHPSPYLAAWDATGQFQWSLETGLRYPLGVVEDNRKGWIVCSSGPNDFYDIQFARFDRGGNKLWTAEFRDFFAFQDWNRKTGFLLKAPDGTLRIVANTDWSLNSVVVAAFALK